RIYIRCQYTYSILCITAVLSYHVSLLKSDMPSFPTRRSSDLIWLDRMIVILFSEFSLRSVSRISMIPLGSRPLMGSSKSRSSGSDRKSTRLNSSHVSISYAVFCFKKKKKNTNEHKRRHNTTKH